LETSRKGILNLAGSGSHFNPPLLHQTRGSGALFRRTKNHIVKSALIPENRAIDSRLKENSCLIVNPAAGRGGFRAKIPALLEIFRARGIATVFQTAAAGEEAALTLRAIRAGATTIVAVGGDGTCTRIGDAIVRSNSSCRLAVVPSGTGNDFAKSLGVDKLPPKEIADLVVRGNASRIDVAQADGLYFLNSCGFGFDASVLEASNQIRFLKGDAIYIYAALRQLFSYRGIEVSVSGVPGVGRDSMLMLTVSNGRWLGGAFKIAPRASLVDGKLDVCVFRDSNLIERVRLFVGALRGTHLEMPSVESARVQRLTLSFRTNPSMEMDGELRVARSTSVELRCIPGALSVIAAPGALER
jgi:diacylglycerol kinase (ATP)